MNTEWTMAMKILRHYRIFTNIQSCVFYNFLTLFYHTALATVFSLDLMHSLHA